jgi:hypothetical protein
MAPLARILIVASLLALPLGGCESFNFDPGDWLSGELFATKKPLPGVRKPVFPNGVPGVVSGIPPELVKGNQQVAGTPPAASALTQETQPERPLTPPAPRAPQVAAREAPPRAHGPQVITPVRAAAVQPHEPKAKRKARAKPKVKRAAKHKPKHKAKPKALATAKAGSPKRDPSPASVWPNPPRQQPAQQVQWPDPPRSQPSQQQVQWPDPPPSPQ